MIVQAGIVTVLPDVSVCAVTVVTYRTSVPSIRQTWFAEPVAVTGTFACWATVVLRPDGEPADLANAPDRFAVASAAVNASARVAGWDVVTRSWVAVPTLSSRASSTDVLANLAI